MINTDTDATFELMESTMIEVKNLKNHCSEKKKRNNDSDK